jgi:hypothetical protein
LREHVESEDQEHDRRRDFDEAACTHPTPPVLKSRHLTEALLTALLVAAARVQDTPDGSDC